MIFTSIRRITEHKTSRKRQCFECCKWIDKGENYICHQFRYDKTILSLYFHKHCYHKAVLLNDIIKYKP